VFCAVRRRGTQCDNDNFKQHKYVRITAHQPDTKSNPNPNSNHNPKYLKARNSEH